MIFRLGLDTRNALANTLRNRIDEGGAGAKIKFYAGKIPDSPNSSADANQTLLGEAQFSHPCADDAVDGILSFDKIEEENSALATETVSWARITDGAGETVFDCDVTGPKGGGMLEINTTRITEGGPIRVRSLTIVIPQG